MDETSEKLGAIVGPARSGTTWAGTLVDSCPDVVYRFEPFHRLSRVNPAVRDILARLKDQRVTQADLAEIYAILVKAHPLTSKAPFFDGKSYRVRSAGRRQLWPLARVLPGLAAIYEAAYSPRPGPRVVFKEVSFMAPLRNLAEKTSIPIVYLVRHPCATVLSSLSGPDGGAMPPRAQQLDRILADKDPALASDHDDILRGSDPVARTALLWRFEVESCVSLVRRSARGLILTYEELASDTRASAIRMFRHLGLPFTAATDSYIDGLLRVDNSQAGVRRTGWGRKYFSVYRNPRDQKESWRKRISASDAGRIEAIVRGAPNIEHCASAGGWW